MDDQKLIERIYNGDHAAIRSLVEENKNLIWHIIITLTGHTRDSEDLFQEVFLRVFKGMKNFRADARLSTWIGSITHHVCIDYLRKKKRETASQPDAKDQISVHGPAPDNSWKSTENEDLNKLVLTAVAKLPADYRTVITLYHLDECSYREIAEITGMPEGTVKSYISRGRSLLREKLIALIPDLEAIMDDF